MFRPRICLSLLLLQTALGAVVELPFAQVGLGHHRGANHCPRTQQLGAQCDGQTLCCRPGLGCNTSGQGDVGQVCVKRESASCSDENPCANKQRCIADASSSTGASFCAYVDQQSAQLVAMQVGPLARRNNAPPPTCTQSITAQAGDTCLGLIYKAGNDVAGDISLTEFYRLNPQVNNPSCNNLQIGTKYCVAGPGTPKSNCMKAVTIKKGETCISVVSRYPGLTLPMFYQLNPSIHNPSCDNLYAGERYCVMGGLSPSSMLAPSSMLSPSSMLTAPSSMLTMAPSSLMAPSSMQMAPSSMMLAPSSMMGGPSMSTVTGQPPQAPPAPTRR